MVEYTAEDIKRLEAEEYQKHLDNLGVPIDTCEMGDDKDTETMWVKYLVSKDICHPDGEGNMPCDWGIMCDKCEASHIREDYLKWLDKQ